MTEFLPSPDVERFPDLADEHLRVIDETVSLGRIYFAGGAFGSVWNRFHWFGPTGSRFDHQAPPPAVSPDRGVLYLAPALIDARGRPMAALETALIECFRDVGVVDARTDLPHFAVFTPTRPLRLLDLADSEWITVAGGNAAISSGPRDRSRQWAAAMYERYNDVDGLIYTTSNRPASRSIALWERATDAVPARPLFNEPLDHLGLRPALEEFTYRIGLGLVY